MIKIKSRKNQLLSQLEHELLIRVKGFVEAQQGALSNTSTTQQVRLLVFCYEHHFYFHCIVLLHGLVKSQEINDMYGIWELFQGKKKFLERQNLEAFWINKQLTFKHLRGIVTHH